MPAGNRIGAHVPIARGLVRGALARADALGAEVVQIFASNPRGWAPGPAPDAELVRAFRAGCAERDLPVFVHAPYLINPAAPDPMVATRSVAALGVTLVRATALGAAGVVVHAGSAVIAGREETARQHAADRLRGVLDAAPAGAPRLLIEPTAGGGPALAFDVDSIRRYLAPFAGDERVGVCLDTCHLHAAGHDLSGPGGLAGTVRRVVRAVGRRRIGLVHVNDSRDPAGSRRDRHAALGSGTVGLAGLGELFTAPGLRGVPLVVETAEEHHAADLAVLRRLRAGASG